jgi:hypothetical protein
MKINILIIFIFSFTTSYSQSIKSEKLKVFLDCKNAPCDNNYIRTEVNLVDFVLDRIAADVHILITAVKSGNGGSKIQYIFFGQNNFKNKADSLVSNVSPNATDVERRTEVVKRIKLGLVPFLSHSSFSHLIDINMKAVKSPAKETEINSKTKDKWDYWIFNVGTDGAINADQVYKSTQISGNLTANRTTDELKINFNSYGGYNKASYVYSNDNPSSKYVVVNSNYSFYHNLIKSIDNHWSVGYETSHSNDTFSNNKSRQYFRPALEYAIFPYSEVNNKYFTINYGVDVRYNRYYETTIYNKTSEMLWGHRAQAYLSLRQKWGNVNSSLTYSNYFNNWSFNNLALSVRVNVRVTGGLSFYLYSNGGLVRDQVYLVKGEASEQDILVRRRQLASAYNFYSGIGLNYRFGSILNNFVNPRFDQP